MEDVPISEEAGHSTSKKIPKVISKAAKQP